MGGNAQFYEWNATSQSWNEIRNFLFFFFYHLIALHYSHSLHYSQQRDYCTKMAELFTLIIGPYVPLPAVGASLLF